MRIDLRTLSIATSFAVVSSLSASSALARTECNRGARICFDVPDHWVTTMQGEMIVVRPPDGGMALEVRGVTQVRELQRARVAFERELGTRCRALEWDTAPSPVQQHGMTGVVRRGHGVYDTGQEMGFFMVVIAHTTGGVAALGVVTRRHIRQNWPTMQRVLNSIRPM